MTLSAYNIALNAVVAPVSGTIARGYAATMKADATGYVVADAANLAAGDGVIYGVLLADGYAGQFVPICNVGLVDASYVGAISGSGDYVDVTSTGALVRASSVTVGQTIGHYLATNGDVQVDLALQFSPSVASISDGYVDIATYGSTHAAITAADAVAQASSPPKTLLLRTAITLGASVSVESPMVVRGGSITGAYTMTIEHSVNAPRVQFVTGSATLAWANGHRQNELYPEWWGADPGGYVCTGATVSGGLTLATGDATVGGSGFDATRDTGKICCVFEQTGSQRAFRSTVASVTSSSRLELDAVSTDDIATSAGAQVWIGTDSHTALRAAIVASRGEIFVSLTPDGEYGVATQLDPRPSAGGLKLRGNWAKIRWCGTAGSHKVFSADDGLNSAGYRSGCDISCLTIDGCSLANDGVYMANESYPNWARSMGGNWRDVRVEHVKRYGHYHHAAQVSVFDRCWSTYTGGDANTFIACNSTTLNQCRGSRVLGASNDSLVLDSWPNPGPGLGDSYGGNDVNILNYVAEVVSGTGIRIDDTVGSGSTVCIFGGHLEGMGEDGIIIDRENTYIGGGISISGPGGTTYYTYRIKSGGSGTTIESLTSGNYGTSQLGGIVEAGATNLTLAPVYNISTNGYHDPSVADGWAGKIQLRRSSGDIHAQGKLYIGTSSPAPAHSIDVEDGNLRLRRGNAMLTQGEVSTPLGGVGRGRNCFNYSEDLSATVWTKTNCTVTTNTCEGPDGSLVTVDLVDCTGSGAYFRQPSVVGGKWQANTAYPNGTIIMPGNGYQYSATIAGTGTSAATEPTWPTYAGETVVDNAGANQITWTCATATLSTTAARHGPGAHTTELALGHTYVASAWVRTPVGTQTVRVGLENTTGAGGGAAGSTSNTDYTVTTAWQRIYGTLLCSGNTASGGVRVTYYPDYGVSTGELQVHGCQLDFIPPRIIEFDTTADVSSANDTITQTNHGVKAGQIGVYYAAAAYALGPTSGTAYYLGTPDADTLTLHTTEAGALAGTGLVGLTSGGAVTQWIMVQPSVPLVPGPYVATAGTCRAVPANGPCSPKPGIAAMGSMKWTAAATATVNDARVTAGSSIRPIPRNAAAATLQGGTKNPYTSAIVPGVSFTWATADGTNAAGTELFDYEITERWVTA